MLYQVAGVLTTVDMFTGMPVDMLARLAEEGRLRRFAPGDRLWVRGAVARSLHVILRGRVRLERRHRELVTPMEIIECGPGEVAGAHGVLDGVLRRDDAVAADETETLELSAPALALLLVQHPRETLALRRTLVVSDGGERHRPARRRRGAGSGEQAEGTEQQATSAG